MVQEVKEENKLALNYNLEEDGFLEVSLLDMTGDLVYNYSRFLKKGTHTHFIPYNRLKGQPYFLRVAKNGNSEINKVLIDRAN